ncbi:MAG: PD40 domain-containing protein [Bacteroidales bacterium]|nr:PD40 domain-containing protein [Bacteroidales bacterium]
MRRAAVLRGWLAVLFCAAGAVASAQVDSVAAALREQHAAFCRRVADDPRDIEALVGLASICSHTESRLCNLPMAIRYADSAETHYVAMMDERKARRQLTKLLKRGINLNSVRQTREQVLTSAFDYVAAHPHLGTEELDQLYDAFVGERTPALTQLLASRRRAAAFAAVCRENSMDAYLAFVQRYPSTAEADECQHRMGQRASQLFASAMTERQVDSLLRPYAQVPSVARSAMKRKSTLAFAAASRRGTPDAFLDYLNRYPSGDEYMQAVDALDALDSTALRYLTEPEQIVQFIHSHAASPLATQAMERLRTMIVQHHNVEAAQLYLAEFPHDASYTDIYRVYYSWFAAEGNADPIANFITANPDFPYATAAEMDLDEGRRIDSIDLRVPFSESQFKQHAASVYKSTGKDVSYVALVRTLQRLVADKDWKGAMKRLDHFALCFESYCTEPYKQLRTLIGQPSAQPHTVTTEATPDYDLCGACPSPDGRWLYYNKVSSGESTICVAQRTTGQGYKWKSVGPLVFENEANLGLTFYSLYDDGRRMLLGRDGNIYTAVALEEGHWRLESALPEPVNSDYNDVDAFMLPDGSGLLLASDRPGGMNCQTSGAYFHGDTALATDLYFVPLTDCGWGPAQNLGPNVNTIYCERSPRVSPDMSTLYFISDGHAGLGYGDIWVCRRRADNTWSTAEPVMHPDCRWDSAANFGKEVNSGFNESDVNLSADGRTVYFCSNRHGRYGCYSTEERTTGRAAWVDVPLAVEMPMEVTVVMRRNHTRVATVKVPDLIVVDTLSLYSADDYLLSASSYDARHALVLPGQGRPGTSLTLPEVRIVTRDNLGDSCHYTLPVDFVPGESRIRWHGELDNLARFLKENRWCQAELMLDADLDDASQAYALGVARGEALRAALHARGIEGTQVVVTNRANRCRQEGRQPVEVEVWLRDRE